MFSTCWLAVEFNRHGQAYLFLPCRLHPGAGEQAGQYGNSQVVTVLGWRVGVELFPSLLQPYLPFLTTKKIARGLFPALSQGALTQNLILSHLSSLSGLFCYDRYL